MATLALILVTALFCSVLIYGAVKVGQPNKNHDSVAYIVFSLFEKENRDRPPFCLNQYLNNKHQKLHRKVYPNEAP